MILSPMVPRRWVARVPDSPRRTARPSPTSLPPPSSLLQELAAAYPEVSGPAIATALDQAWVAATALGGGRESTAARTALLARDRLDVVRERALAAARRVGSPHVRPRDAPARRTQPPGLGADRPLWDTKMDATKEP